ncbi:hypothetical protein [Winogradskya humida]|uniref:Lipoprotein n=1 Tax=Winogradskya humida TaxID=113566 RepID=A0ABQ3ZW25_9ACTN|nr:hypothetical protein [Actinoplanes humidus]GIE22766.1 hypothetical protein Ahu01nite_058680 [Actinoplanes humidus]
MRTPRLAGLGLASMAAVAFAAGGCSADGSTTPGAGASAGATASAGVPGASASAGAADPAAAAALAGATAKLGTSSFKLTMTSGSGFKVDGLIDSPNGVGTATLTATGPNTQIEVKTLLVDQDLYVQVPGVTKAGTWTHLDVSRLPEGANTGLRPGQIDPANTSQLLTSTTDVRQTGSGSYAGTLDLTKAAGVAGVDQKMITAWGSQAQNVPFTAGLDDQGRLSALTIQLPAVSGQQAQPLEVLYTDYGTKVDAKRPAATEITEAPDSLYSSLGS